MVQLLLRRGANPNHLGGKEAYPIQVAARTCPDSVVPALIDASADVKPVHSGHSALASAVGRKLESAAITTSLLASRQSLSVDSDEADKLVSTALAIFDGIPEPTYDDENGADGHFLHSSPLDYVFGEGPGAVLELVLSHFEIVKLEGYRYHLVLQMACLLEVSMPTAPDTTTAAPCKLRRVLGRQRS